jgi:hypothetical protein
MAFVCLLGLSGLAHWTAVVSLIPKVGVVPGGIFFGVSNTDGLHARTPNVFMLGQDWQVHQTGRIGFSPDNRDCFVEWLHCRVPLINLMAAKSMIAALIVFVVEKFCSVPI